MSPISSPGPVTGSHQAFNADRSVNESENVGRCFSCHKSQAAQDFVERYRNSRANSLGHNVGMEVHDVRSLTATLEPGQFQSTLELKANFLNTAAEGVLYGEARAVHLGRTTQVWDAVVSHGEERRKLALFRCTQLVLYPK